MPVLLLAALLVGGVLVVLVGLATADSISPMRGHMGSMP
jgi:hypothetical protein